MTRSIRTLVAKAFHTGLRGRLALPVMALLLGCLSPGVSEAQAPARPKRIGVLSSGSMSGESAIAGPLHQWSFRGDVAFEYQPRDRDDRLPALAAELVSLKVDLILAMGRAAALAAKAATTTIPVVMVVSGDPVRAGLVSSLGRPGGNVTGMTTLSQEIAGKRLQFLTEAIPGVRRVGVLWNPADPDALAEWREAQAAARILGVHVESLEVRAPSDLEPAFQHAAQSRSGALMVLEDRLTATYAATLVGLAARSKVPAIYPSRYFVQPPQNGLMSYGPSAIDIGRRVASHIDRILKGAMPGELPVEQPSQFDLVVNLRTASALGVRFPKSLLEQVHRAFE